MSSKRKLQFNNLISEYGFPTDIRKISMTYVAECLDEGSDMYIKSRIFEEQINAEIERQNSTLDDSNGELDFYQEFEKIFLAHSELFDPESYLLQLSVLLEKDLLTRTRIKSILSMNGLKNPSEELIEYLFSKDDDTVNDLLKYLTNSGVNIKDAIRAIQNIRELPDSNVWISPRSKKNTKTLLSTVRDKLKGSDVALIEQEGSTLNVINSQVHIGEENFLLRKESENSKKYEVANEKINLDERIKKLTPSDLKYIFRYDNLGAVLSQNLYYSTYEVDNSTTETILKDPMTNLPYAQEEIFKTIKNNLRYIDFDKLLLTVLGVELDKYGGNINYFSLEEAKELDALVKEVEKILSKKDIEVSSDRYEEAINFKRISSQVERLNNSFIKDVYYSEEDLDNLVQEYTSGRKDPRTLSAREFRDVLKFTDGEILIMLKLDPTLLDYLIKNNIVQSENRKDDPDKKLFELIEQQDRIPGEQLQILYEAGKLSPIHLFQLYMNTELIALEDIQLLRESADEQFWDSMIDTSKLVDLYLDKDKQPEKFDKYSRLYRELVISGKTIEEKNEISSQILEQSMELLEGDTLIDLYRLGLVTIDTVLDYTGGTKLKELYLSNELKPADARRLFYGGIITEDMLKSIMLDTKIDEGRKITLLYSTFPDVEDTEVMRRLEEFLPEVVENSKFNKSKQQKTSTTKGQIGKQDVIGEEFKKLRKVYEPRAKYRLLSIIDPDYTFKYNEKDGTGIFYFPNREEYVIEKLYDKGRKPATGVATYIVDKTAFEQNKDKFVQDEVVNISELYAFKKSSPKQVTRLIHTGWANAIVKYYGLDDKSRYTESQISEIKELAKQVEEYKQEIER